MESKGDEQPGPSESKLEFCCCALTISSSTGAGVLLSLFRRLLRRFSIGIPVPRGESMGTTEVGASGSVGAETIALMTPCKICDVCASAMPLESAHQTMSPSIKTKPRFVKVMSDAQPADVVFEAPGCG